MTEIRLPSPSHTSAFTAVPTPDRATVGACAASAKAVLDRIAAARAQAHARGDSTLAPRTDLLAVSKGHNAAAIAAFHAAGLRDFGENYAQELVSKARTLRDAGGYADIRWHFIGLLQSNKAKDVLPLVSHVHSLDRVSLLDALEKHASPERTVGVYLQLVVDPADTGKHGADAASARVLAARLGRHRRGAGSGLEWVGFMGMGPADADDGELARLYSTFHTQALALWREFHPEATTREPAFSLGMSGDLDVAIACGSTLVRVGTALFGPRAGKAGVPTPT